MSFDVAVYFPAVAPDLEARWQAALRELGMTQTARIPPDWQSSGFWHLLEKPTDVPEHGFIEAGPVGANALDRFRDDAEAMALLAPARYVAALSTRLSAGSGALMIAGTIARATGGVMWDPQGAAFEPVFERDLAPHRGPKGSAGKPTLVERGFYSPALAWEVAKAAAAYERRQAAPAPQPASEAPKSPSTNPWIVGGLGLLLLGAIFKLARRKSEQKEQKDRK